MNSPLLRTEDLDIGYAGSRGHRRIVAQGLSLSLFSGEIASIIGPNGVGKSTLIRTVAGLQSPLRGRVYVQDRELDSYTARELARCVSVVLTEQIHVGMLTSLSLVSLGRYPFTDWTGRLSQRDLDVIRWALRSVGAESLAERYVEQLSDGERQKIMIARALAQEPHIILLDEPTAFLDVTRRVEIMDLLRRLTRETVRSILLSTHDLELALRVSDRIFLLSTGGRLTAGAPEDLVLGGSMEEVFQNEGLVFDRERGSFVITQQHRGSVTLLGEGLAFLWTSRALERAGFKVSEQKEKSRLQVEIITRDRLSVWRLTLGEQSWSHNTIYDLVRSLRILESGTLESRARKSRTDEPKAPESRTQEPQIDES
jgi:iron complex transport system ATP-binding protein